MGMPLSTDWTLQVHFDCKSVDFVSRVSYKIPFGALLLVVITCNFATPSFVLLKLFCSGVIWLSLDISALWLVLVAGFLHYGSSG